MKGPGIATVQFKNCGEDKVVLSVDGNKLAESTTLDVSHAFVVGTTANVNLKAEGTAAMINVIQVKMHCTGGLWVGIVQGG